MMDSLEVDIFTPNIIEIFTAYIDAGNHKLGIRPPTFIAQLVKVDVQDDSLRCVTLKDGQGQLFSALIRDSSIDNLLEETAVHCAQYRLTQDEKRQFQVYLFELDAVERLENAETCLTETSKLAHYRSSRKNEWVTVTCTEWQMTPSATIFKIADAGYSMQCTAFQPIKDILLRYQKDGLVLSIKNPEGTLLSEKYRKIAGVEDEVKLNTYSNFRVINPEDNSILYEHKSTDSCPAKQQDDNVSANAVQNNEKPSLDITGERMKIAALTETLKHDWIRATTERVKQCLNCIRVYLRDDSGLLLCTIFSPVLEEIQPLLANGLIVELKNSQVKKLDEQFCTDQKTLESKVNQYSTIKLLNPLGEILYEHAPKPAKPKISSNIQVTNQEDNPIVPETKAVDSCPMEHQDDEILVNAVENVEPPPPVQITRQYFKIAALTTTLQHDWIRATTEGVKHCHNSIRFWLKDDSGSLPCTIFSPVFEKTKSLLTHGLIVELKNSQVKELPAQFRTGGAALEIKVNQFSSIKLFDPSGKKILYKYLPEGESEIHEYRPAAKKFEAPTPAVKCQTKDLHPATGNSNQVSSIAIKTEEPVVQIAQTFVEMASLEATNTHDWICATVENVKPLTYSMWLRLRDKSTTMPCTIPDSLFPCIRLYGQRLNGSIVHIKNSLVHTRNDVYQIDGNQFTMTANSHTSIRIVDKSGTILHDGVAKSVPTNVSEPVQPSERVLQNKRPAEAPVEQLPVKKIHKENQVFMKLSSLKKDCKHDWIQVRVESPSTKGSKATLTVYDDTVRMRCEILEPIFPAVGEFLEEGTVLKLKNTKVQDLDSKFHQKDLSILELTVNRDSSIKVRDTKGNAYSYSPSHPSPIITRIPKTNTKSATIFPANANVTRTTSVSPQIQVQQISRQTGGSEDSFLASIQDLQTCKHNNIINIRGYVVCGSLESKRRKSGCTTLFRCVKLEDETGCVDISMWGPTAEQFSYPRSFVSFKNLKVNVYYNKRELIYATGSSTHHI